MAKEDIYAEAIQIIRLEWVLAQNGGPDPDFENIYNPISISNATSFFPSSLDIPSMLDVLGSETEGLSKAFKNPDYLISFASPDNYAAFAAQLDAIGSYSISGNTVWNYFFFRLLFARSNYLPGHSPPPYTELHKKSTRIKGIPQGIKRPPPKLPEEGHPIYATLNYTPNEFKCSLACKCLF